MLNEMGWKKFREWQVYEMLEPFEDTRGDYRAAHIVQTLLRGGDRPLKNFLLEFGDSIGTQRSQQQSVKDQERMLDAWVIGSNAVLKKQ